MQWTCGPPGRGRWCPPGVLTLLCGGLPALPIAAVAHVRLCAAERGRAGRVGAAACTTPEERRRGPGPGVGYRYINRKLRSYEHRNPEADPTPAPVRVGAGVCTTPEERRRRPGPGVGYRYINRKLRSYEQPGPPDRPPTDPHPPPARAQRGACASRNS